METFIRNCIAEFRAMQNRRPPGTEYSILETALFLEDAFGILLEEDELNDTHLGPAADLAALVSEKMKKG